ncbi:MAG: hypothetical protein RR475_07065 [Clostridia bacterium]
MMEHLPVNPECELSGTKCCRLLNMHTCEACTVRNSDNKAGILQDIALYETLLPEGGVSQLFTARDCQFCKMEPKGKRKGYAILDMAHPEPKRVQRWLLGKRQLKIGTMIPVQMSICSACRRRFLLLEYLPIVIPIVLGVAGLLLISIDAVSAPLNRMGSFLPLVLWLLLIGVGILVGRLWGKHFKKKCARIMYADVLEHPVIAGMLQKGWMPITKQSGTKVLFSKSRLARGLGTAEDVQGDALEQENN